MRTRTDERYSTRWGGRKCSMSTLNTEKANFARLFEWGRFLLGRWKQTNNFQRLKSRTGYRSYFSLGSSQFLSSCLPWSLSLLKLFYYIVCRRPCVLPRRRPSYTNIIHKPNITISLPTRITLLLYSQAATAPDYRSIAFSFRKFGPFKTIDLLAQFPGGPSQLGPQPMEKGSAHQPIAPSTCLIYCPLCVANLHATDYVTRRAWQAAASAPSPRTIPLGLSVSIQLQLVIRQCRGYETNVESARLPVNGRRRRVSMRGRALYFSGSRMKLDISWEQSATIKDQLNYQLMALQASTRRSSFRARSRPTRQRLCMASPKFVQWTFLFFWKLETYVFASDCIICRLDRNWWARVIAENMTLFALSTSATDGSTFRLSYVDDGQLNSNRRRDVAGVPFDNIDRFVFFKNIILIVFMYSQRYNGIQLVDDL